MIDIKEALLIEIIEELEVEIKERKNLLNTLVGNFYPAIIQDEINDLESKLLELKARAI